MGHGGAARGPGWEQTLLSCLHQETLPLPPELSQRPRRRAIGLGSGQRRSLAFEDFVLKNRRVLREELKLCERARQRILEYTNNFLHKKLKTSSQKPARVEWKKGKGALGLLKPIAELGEETCCAAHCTVALDPCPSLQAMLVSALPSTGGEMTSPCTRRPAGTFSPAPAAAPKAVSASLAPSSPLPHRAQTEQQQHLRGLGYTRDPAHPAQPSPLAQSLALSQLLSPDSRLRPARQQMQGVEEIWQGQELQPPLILMGANKRAVPGGRFLGGCGAGAERGLVPNAEQRLPSQLVGGNETRKLPALPSSARGCPSAPGGWSMGLRTQSARSATGAALGSTGECPRTACEWGG
ncbi:uncharacterized protein LOC115636030 isoform X2 [Gopherus evgoodei]|uniref:uncharacterized protein LOC115636030 isoform X2 n=1 Tax=Gopherus evgoodei TaxID=1825980 RepID=UPI0011D01215|nr:uncharacterized protein LOC115636030 isoform X2 [Gopherus evgoodei]